MLSEQHARCALPTMARNAQVFVDYQAEFAEPGNYDVTFTAAASGDTAPDNNTLVRAVLVRPYNDIAIDGGLDFRGSGRGLTREQRRTPSRPIDALSPVRASSRRTTCRDCA